MNLTMLKDVSIDVLCLSLFLYILFIAFSIRNHKWVGYWYISKGNLRFPLKPSLQVKIGMFPVAEGGKKLTNDVGRSPESFVHKYMYKILYMYLRWREGFKGNGSLDQEKKVYLIKLQFKMYLKILYMYLRRREGFEGNRRFLWFLGWGGASTKHLY